ncbi:SWIM zinc finger family protein [Myroides pelagicus]|uniref:SWIM zinc finger family protein n=1 Tax=Myroides pelagicus TaxID=270914 RepID=A0A7K1GPZ6_9FLAO|nr:SWIM zinc finger family protein [Myroides pelagicus]MEC4112680.1 SWIM zinc finger family protein [Myroides pelagicus]MTH30921.1 SWIM zinc finger family protein [Myroides pelagicus]
MNDILSYRYNNPSSLTKGKGGDELFLAKYSEIQKNTDAPCFFSGNVKNPFIMGRCLITLSSVVKSSFNLSPTDLAKLKDPIATAGDGRVRFEGFSHCAGVYARVDVLPDGLEGEFLENGTTNVDFNQPMLTALNSIKQTEKVLLSIGQKEVSIQTEEKKIVERRVPLPIKWVKGLSTVQIYLSKAEHTHTFNKIQTQQLFRGIPKGVVKMDYYLVTRGNMPMFSAVKSANAVCVGAIHRLRLLEPLLPYMDSMQVFPHPDMQSTTWQLYFGPIRFSLSLSREAYRGFSGEGAALESLIEDIDDEWIDAIDKYAYANQRFNPTLMAMEEGFGFKDIDNLTARMVSMGLLGFDLDENAFFYRRLPFKLERIMSLNPRLKNAEKLIVEKKVEIISNANGRVEARVDGTGGVRHMVILDGEQQRCTCEWYGKYQGDRGMCKHVLAVNKIIG